MVQLQILNGKMAGRVVPVRHFPFRIGRDEQSDLKLSDPGVWGRHGAVRFNRDQGFLFQPETGATTLLADQSVIEERRLPNRCILTLGGTQLLFALSDAQQKNARTAELGFWLFTAALLAAQIWIVVRLL